MLLYLINKLDGSDKYKFIDFHSQFAYLWAIKSRFLHCC